MINEQLADGCIELLNEALALDAKAVSELFACRVECSPKLAAHRRIQCGPDSIGMLGILNGLCGVFDSGRRKGWGPITAVVEQWDLETIARFERTRNDGS
jgi:hypothetical protein